MPSTTNFGWTTPADTDLVKDGAAAIRTLGNGIDTSFLDLKGGTSGQILAKNSNTDLDFVWVANDQGDITAVTAGTGISGGGTSGAVTITNSMATEITASGDIIVGTGSGTFDNLPIGSTGQVLTADTTVSPYKVKWAAAAAGGLTELASGTLSGSTVSLTSISGSHKHLQLVIRNFKPSNDNAQFNLRANGDSTADRHRTEFADGIQENIPFNATVWNPHGHNDNSTATGLIVIHIWDYANTTTWKVFESFTISNDSATPANANYYNNAGAYNQTGAITSLDLLPSGGTFTSGTYILYGVS